MGKIIGILAILMCSTAFAQNNLITRPGLISTSMTISPSIMLDRGEVNYYLTGFLEGRLDSHIGLRGESYYFVDSDKENPYFNEAIRTSFGIHYYFLEGNFSPYIGFLPGLSVVSINDFDLTEQRNTYKVIPTATVNAGVSFYVHRNFHFFANVAYIHSKANGLINNTVGANELAFAGGLGINLQVFNRRK